MLKDLLIKNVNATQTCIVVCSVRFFATLSVHVSARIMTNFRFSDVFLVFVLCLRCAPSNGFFLFTFVI